jgi:glycosyltransferase involved in cell wall biosynthesis
MFHPDDKYSHVPENGRPRIDGISAMGDSGEAMRPDFSLVVPCFNEAEILEKSTETILAYMPSVARRFEVILSDDGSSDETLDIIRNLDEEYGEIRWASGPHEGKGSALTRGFQAARGEIQAFLDADLEIAPEYLGDLLAAIRDGADIAIGSKYAATGRRKSRKMATMVYNTMVRVLFGSRIQDHQAGIKAFRRDVVEKILPAMTSRGWIWDTEFLVRAAAEGYSVREIPIEVRPGRGSRVSMVMDSWRMFRAVMGLKLAGAGQGAKKKRRNPLEPAPPVNPSPATANPETGEKNSGPDG